MKLVRVEHYRCSEWWQNTYLMAPDDLTEEQLEADAEAAYKEFLEARDAFEQIGEKPEYPTFGYLKDFPDEMTIAEAKQEFESRKAKYEMWKKKRDAAAKSFQHYMLKKGYKGLYEADCIEAVVYWGHRHGEHLKID